MLIIGLVLSALNAMAEVKTVIAAESKSGGLGHTFVEVKANEILKILYWDALPTDNSKIDAYLYLNIGDNEKQQLHSSKTGSFVCAGPLKLEIVTPRHPGNQHRTFSFFWVLTIEITPNEKH